MATGCASAGARLAVPMRSGEYDYAGLRRCVTRLKKAAPEFAEEDRVTVSASPEVAYDALIATMDAVRATEDGRALFPDGQLGIVR